MTPSLHDVGERIDQERKACGHSIREFCAAIGISERHYRRVRTGADISDELLLTICAVTGRDPNYFLIPPEGNPFSSAQLSPELLGKLNCLPPWAYQTVIVTMRELERICHRER